MTSINDSVAGTSNSTQVNIRPEEDERSLECSTVRAVTRRLIPFLFVLYVVCFLDRVNVGFAALEMNRDLGLGPAVYGFGAGIFFIGYSLCEVPSNLILARVGARRWIARIMITWGLIAAGMMFARGPLSLCVLRFLLGAAEGGFFPGMIYYLSHWFPASARAHAIARFMTAIPLSGIIGGPISGALLGSTAGWESPAGSGSSFWRAFPPCCLDFSFSASCQIGPNALHGSGRNNASGSLTGWPPKGTAAPTSMDLALCERSQTASYGN